MITIAIFSRKCRLFGLKFSFTIQHQNNPPLKIFKLCEALLLGAFYNTREALWTMMPLLRLLIYYLLFIHLYVPLFSLFDIHSLGTNKFGKKTHTFFLTKGEGDGTSSSQEEGHTSPSSQACCSQASTSTKPSQASR